MRENECLPYTLKEQQIQMKQNLTLAFFLDQQKLLLFGHNTNLLELQKNEWGFVTFTKWK